MKRALFGGGALLLAACSGEIGGGPNGGTEVLGDDPRQTGGTGSGAVGSGAAGATGGGSGGTPSPPLDNSPDAIAEACAKSGDRVDVGVTRLRRLTRDELDNTIRDLFGVVGAPVGALAPDERIGPFFSNAIAPITNLLVEQLGELAAAVAADATPRMQEIAPCDLEDGDGACVRAFVEDLGGKAYRRPLQVDEANALIALYELGAESGGPAGGFRLLVEALLQSPSFLYHAPVGTSGAPTAAPDPIDPYAVASRLSYFLWKSMPDRELFAVAGDGSLVDANVLGLQVDRMLADPKAAETIASFHRQWLGLTELDAVQKDAARFPTFGEASIDAMLNEAARFTRHVVLEGDGLLHTLLTGSFAFPEGPLFEIYGIAEPQGFVPGDQVALNPAERAGLLTQAAFLSRWAHPDQTSPVHRGIVVRENLLCQPIPSPPANVNNVPPPPTEITSTRERFAQHVADPSCAGCHTLIDPVGLGFEHYDPVGAYRTVDGLGPVDASGELTGVRDDLAGPFVGGIELAHKLAQSEEVADCVATQWFRFALGRVETQDDACSVKAIHDGFRLSGGNVREL
ncbi:MAG TPA: DUF1592 domain-containing protein, partial [Polyangiaceae bacterium]|nr:DUF1592 domain-containing protein [Polyangiaceae bacterium]